MDRSEYVQRMEEKLKDEQTYKKLDSDQTQEIRNALCETLKRIRDEGQMTDSIYYRLYPTQCQVPRMYGHPKIHKDGYPLREIVDGTGGVVKQVDKYIAGIIKQYVEDTDHYIKNSRDFVEKVKDVTVGADETLVSYDVTALYPSVPQDEAIELISEKLHADAELRSKTTMSAANVIALYRLCVQRTYFAFNRQLYQQVDGLAIGASTSGFGAEIFMQRFEYKALTTFTSPPDIWKRYVDDTFAKLKITVLEEFLTHLNSQHPRIKFTTEVLDDQKIAFLDTLVTLEADGTISFNIYRKKTHTDQYLDFGSHHYKKQKTGLYKNFKHRIDTIVTKEEDRAAEDKHVREALRRCGHPEWALTNKKQPRKEPSEPALGRVSLPYVAKTSEKIAKVLRSYNIQTAHRPVHTIKSSMFGSRKDKVEDLDKSCVVYHCECAKCKESYVGETARCMRVRMYEHKVVSHKDANTSHSVSTGQTQAPTHAVPQPQRSSARLRTQQPVNYRELHTGAGQQTSEGSSPLSQHMATVDHQRGDVQVKVVSSEQIRWRRQLKETLTIHRINPTLNEDDGAYKLPAIYTSIPKFGTRNNRIAAGTAIPNETRSDLTAAGTAIPNETRSELNVSQRNQTGTRNSTATEEINATEEISAEVNIDGFSLDQLF
jgi:hypothetical protein